MSDATGARAAGGELSPCPCVEKTAMADLQTWWLRDGATFTCQCGRQWRYTNRPHPWGEHVYSWEQVPHV